MILTKLIRKGGLREFAVANMATQSDPVSQRVAEVAEVAALPNNAGLDDSILLTEEDALDYGMDGSKR